jgi:hypothetical protein
VATTYQGLLDEILAWTNRPDLEQTAPSFVTFAEAWLNRTLRVQPMLRRARTTLDGHYIPLPIDFLEARNVQINAGTQGVRRLLPATLDIADRLREVAPPTGQATHFVIVGDALEVVPVESGGPEIEMAYYARVPALSATTPVNWLLLQSPEIYLYASLAHASAFLADDARIPVWRAQAEKMATELNQAGTRMVYGEGPLVRKRSTF